MNRRTRISGWTLVAAGEPNKPFEVFAKKHISPENAIAFARQRGIDLNGYISIEHQITGLPRWYREAGPGNPIKKKVLDYCGTMIYCHGIEHRANRRRS